MFQIKKSLLPISLLTVITACSGRIDDVTSSPSNPMTSGRPITIKATCNLGCDNLLFYINYNSNENVTLESSICLSEKVGKFTFLPTQVGRSKSSFNITLECGDIINSSDYYTLNVIYNESVVLTPNPIPRNLESAVVLTASIPAELTNYIGARVDFYAYYNDRTHDTIRKGYGSCALANNPSTGKIECKSLPIRASNFTGSPSESMMYATVAKLANGMAPIIVSSPTPTPTPSPSPTPTISPTPTPSPTPTSVPTKIIFMTSLEFNGNLGGFSGANDKCNAASNKPPGTYKALLNGNNATTSGVNYTRVDGTSIATATDGNLVGFANITHSVVTSYAGAWTGGAGNDCDNWSVSSSGMNGDFGIGSVSDKSWYYYYNTTTDLSQPQTCSDMASLYCVQQ